MNYYIKKPGDGMIENLPAFMTKQGKKITRPLSNYILVLNLNFITNIVNLFSLYQ